MDPLTINRLGHIRHQEIITEAQPSAETPRQWLPGLHHFLMRIIQQVRHLMQRIQPGAISTAGDTRAHKGSVPGQ